MSPGEFAAIYPSTYDLDIRPVIGTIRVPTLVLHRSENWYMCVGNGRYLAEHIVGATLIELPGRDHFFSRRRQRRDDRPHPGIPYRYPRGARP